MSEEKIIVENNEQEAKQETKSAMIPVFMGTELVELVELVDLVVKDKFPDHEIAIMSPRIYADMALKHRQEKMTNEQRKAIIDAQRNNEMKEKAEEVASHISAMNIGDFTAQELKKAYLLVNKRLSNKQVDELINFMGTYGFVRPISDVENTPSYKIKYRVTLEYLDISQVIQQRNSVIKSKIAELTKEFELNEAELKDLIKEEPKKKSVAAPRKSKKQHVHDTSTERKTS